MTAACEASLHAVQDVGGQADVSAPGNYRDSVSSIGLCCLTASYLDRGVDMGDSIDFHIAMIATSTNILCCSVKMSRLYWNLRQKGWQSGHVTGK